MSVRDPQDDVFIGHVVGADTGGDSVLTAILDVQIRFTSTLPVIRLGGELDLGSVHLLADAVECVATTAVRADLVLLDLSGVTFCDVAGLRAMETCALTLRAAGKELVLDRPPRSVTRLIAMTGVARGLLR